MENVTDSDWAHAKIVCKDFGIENFKKYLDLYVLGILLAGVFEILEICVSKYMN